MQFREPNYAGGTQPFGNNLRDLCIRTGCDTYLCMDMPLMWGVEDYDSPTARAAMRDAIHNIAYAVANSNAMENMVPGSTVEVSPSPWAYLIGGIDAIVALLIAGGVVLMVRRTKAERANPDAFKRSRRAQCKLDARRTTES